MSLVRNCFPFSPYHNRIYFGQSGSGKTFHFVNWVVKFNKYYPNTKVQKVLLVAPTYLQDYTPIWKKYPDICHYFDTLDEKILENVENIEENSICIFIVDDLASNLNKSPLLEKMFTTMTRHKRLHLIFTCQSLYASNSDVFRSITKNAHSIILMNSPRERQSIHNLFRQIFGKQTSNFADFVLDEALQESKKRYNNPFYNVCLNTTPNCEDCCKISSDILSDYPIVYIKGRN